MITDHIREALKQVKQVQRAVLERQRFRGYSGRARALSGWLALAASVFMSSEFYWEGNLALVIGWGAVFVLALLMNLAALIHWFFNNPQANRDVRRLSPIVDTIAPIVVGGVISVSMTLYGFHNYLFGVWMCMFGLTNLVSRHVLPKAIVLVGVFYILCGSFYVLSPEPSLSNPWPMGLVFFFGELVGGLILHFDQRRYVADSSVVR